MLLFFSATEAIMALPPSVRSEQGPSVHTIRLPNATEMPKFCASLSLGLPLLHIKMQGFLLFFS